MNGARMGLMGFMAVLLVLTIIGLAVYGFVERPDHDLTAQLFAALIAGAGGVLAAVGAFFKGDRVNLNPFIYPPPDEQVDILPDDLDEGKG